MSSTSYTITKRNGETITFETDLTVDGAADIVGNLPLTEFSGSLMLAYRRGTLSPAQQLWLLKLAHDATAARNATGPYASLVAAVNRMQQKAKGRVSLRLDGVTVKAVTRGVNSGCAYLYRPSGDYVGKLTAGGVCHSAVEPELRPTLSAANADPVAAARAYGYQTGSCACCGRTLSDPVSVFGGIGPVCLERLAGPEARRSLAAEYKASGGNPLVP